MTDVYPPKPPAITIPSATADPAAPEKTVTAKPKKPRKSRAKKPPASATPDTLAVSVSVAAPTATRSPLNPAQVSQHPLEHRTPDTAATALPGTSVNTAARSSQRTASPQKSTKTNPDTGLTDQVELWCKEFILDYNGTRAAIAAGYSTKGAHVQSARLLKNVKVQIYLKELQRPRLEKLEVSADRIMEEVCIMAFSDIANYGSFDKAVGGFVFDIDKINANPWMTRAIKKIKYKELPAVMTADKEGELFAREVYGVEVELWPKPDGLDKLMKRWGLLKEEVRPPEAPITDIVDVARRMALVLDMGMRAVQAQQGGGVLPPITQQAVTVQAHDSPLGAAAIRETGRAD